MLLVRVFLVWAHSADSSCSWFHTLPVGLLLLPQTLVVCCALDLVLISRVGWDSSGCMIAAYVGLLAFLGLSLAVIGGLLAFHTVLAVSGMTSREVWMWNGEGVNRPARCCQE